MGRRQLVWMVQRGVVVASFDWRARVVDSFEGVSGREVHGIRDLSFSHTHTVKKKYLQGSLKAVIINLKPLTRVPHESVTYLSVTKFVRVNITPTDCFVLLHVMSACAKTKTKQNKKHMKWIDFYRI